MYEHYPDAFAGPAVRVDLREEDDLILDAYFEWRADTF